jgi:hypothetical protein
VSEIVDFLAKRREMAARRGFRNWVSRFSEPFDEHTRFRDVSEKTLGALINGGEVSTQPVYDLVMGFLGLGAGYKFDELEVPDKMEVMDMVIFLLDQFRFEAMRRLGWVEDDPAFDMSLVEAIEQYSTSLAAGRHRTPELSATHPSYEEYCRAFGNDRYAAVRRLIPEAIAIYEQKTAEDPDR